MPLRQCDNLGMNSRFSPLFRTLPALALGLLMAAAAQAQEANVLGLPAIPQPKPGSAAPPAAGGGGATPRRTARDVLSGELGLQHSALSGVGRLLVTTRATYTTAGARSQALDAARSVQRDLAQSCGKQCKPEKMAAPKILPAGQLEFELAFKPLHQHLTQAQFMALLRSEPLNLTPAQLTPPAPAASAPQ